MVETFKLLLHFVAASTPVPPGPGPEPTPTPGGGGTSVASQTGDINLLLFFAVLFVAIAAVLMLFLAARAKAQGTNMKSVAVNYAFKFATNARLAVIGALVVAAIALLCGITLANAFATSNEDASNTVNVYVNEETGVITSIDQGTYTNETGHNIAATDIATSIAEEAQSITGLENATLTIMNGTQIFYQGKIGTSYTPTTTTYVADGQTLTFTFEFKDLAADTALQLIDKDAVGLNFNEKGYHTITYDGNGNTGGTAPAPVIKIDDTTAKISGNTGGLVKGEATFNGWNTNAEGTGTPYVEGQNYTDNEDLKLFAVYKEPTTDVTLTYKIIDEYQDMSHGSVALTSGGTAAWQVTESFNPDSATPVGAKATPKDSEENDVFGNWEFSHWSIVKDGEEVCVSESAQFVPTLETLGLTTWVDTTITAHFGKAVALFDPNAETLTFKYTEDEDVFAESWALPVYKDAHFDRTPANVKLPSWFTHDGTLKCYPRTAIIEKDFKHFKGITSLDMWFASSKTLASLYNMSVQVANRKLDKIEGLENIDTSEVVSTVAMFADNCGKMMVQFMTQEERFSFSTIDLSSWVTPKLKDTSYMFADCWNLQQVLLPTDQTSVEGSFGTTVENMDDMFLYCSSLANLSISTNFGAKAKTTNDMFNGCSSLKAIDAPVGNKFLSSCTECSDMFCGCQGLRKVDLSNLNVNNNIDAEDIQGALYGCDELRYVTVGAGTTWTNSDLSLNDMGLTNEDYDENGIWYSTDENSEIAKKAEEIPAAHIGQKTNITYRTLCSKAIYNDAANAKSLTFYYDHKVYNTVEFSLDTALNTKYMMQELGRDLYPMYDKPIFPEWYSYTATADGANVGTYQILGEYDSATLIPNLDLKITLTIDAEKVVFDPSFKKSQDLYSMAYFFMADSTGKQTFKTFDGWGNVNTKHIRNYACMFGGFSYKSIAQNPNDYLAYKISNVPPLDKLPYYNAYANDTYGTAFETVDISDLDIFSEEENMENIGLLNFNFMFANCTNLKSVTFPAPPVNRKDYMGRAARFNHTFENCQSLESVPDTLKESYYISYAQYMFWNCTNLKTADLEGWRVNSSKDWDDYGYNMFSGCNNLITVKTDENWCWKMNICGLIETWPDGIEPTEFNPWKWKEQGYDPIYVWQIPFDDYYQPTNHGTFKRDENTKGMAQANISSVDTTQGTVSPGTVNFVGTVIVIPLADGNIKVGDTVVKATPADGYEVAYWTCNGKKIIDVDINSKLPQLIANGDSPKDLQVHFRKANYRPKAVYNETSKTMTMYYDDQTHAGEGRVFDINPNTYLQPSLGHGKVPAFYPEVLLSNSENGQSNADTNNIYTGYWDYTEFEISLPSWYEFRQDNENQRFYINSLVAPETVVFDSTFADYDELQSISMWFMADSDNDQTIKTFKSVDAQGNELAPFANLNTTSIQNVEYAFGGLYLNRYFNSSGAAAAASAADFLFDTLLGDPASAVTYNSSYNTYGNSIKELDMSGFDFSKLRSMDWMFANCQAATKIKFDQNFNTTNLISMEGVFNNCENCTEISGLAGSKVNTINVDNMDNLFQGCSHIESLDLSKFDTRNVYKNEEYPWWDILLTDGNRSYFTHNKMFLDCVRLNEIKITSNYDQIKDEWTGWTLYMDMCDLPSNENPDDNWKVYGDDTSYSPFEIPLTIDDNSPTSQDDLIQGTITRNRPSIYTVDIKTGDATKGQIAYLNNTQERWQYDYINSINISTIQDAEQAAAPAAAKFANETAQVPALYVDDRTYFAVPENGYELLNWTATWEDSAGNAHTWVFNDQSSLYLDGDNKADITVTASFKEKGAEAWALLSEDSNGNGYFSFRYDKNVYMPGTSVDITLNKSTIAQTTVIKAYTVSYNHDDYNFPLWYDDSSIWAYYDCDKHSYIPGFDNEFSKYSIGNNPLTIVFEDNFKNFDTLESLSCFFMQAPKASDGFYSLVTPFAFDSDHFKGLSNICMDHVWNVKYMFGGHEYFNDINGSKAFETIDLTGLDMSKLNNLDAMFANCLNLKSITWPKGFDCSKITSMYKTFFNCDALYGDDLLNVLDGLDTSNVTDMSYMFAKRHFYDEEQQLQNEAIDIDYIFPSTFTVASVTNMTRMFAGNEFAKSINIKTQTTLFELFASEQDNANALTVDATGMFESCSNLQTLTSDSSSWFAKISIKTAVNMFAYCYALTNEVPAQLGEATFPDFTSCTDMYGMFQSCSSMTEFVPSTKTNKFTTTSVIYMNYMFADSGLENFVVGKSGSPRSFDTSNVVEFVGMFYNCNNLQKVDLARDKLANTKLIVDAEDMFRYCSNITDLTLKSFIFDSDENFNKNRYVPRTFLWDNDRESVIGISQQWGTFHPYSNMFANISTTGSIQSFEIDGKWNGNLGDVSRMQQSDNSFPALKDDYSCGFPKSYYAEDLYGNYRAIPILWRLDLNNSHIIGEAGEITKYDSYEGTVTLPFGGHRFERVIDDNDDTYNKFIHFLPNNSQIGVSITSPDIALPPSFSMKFIDLTDCTSLSYTLPERSSENDVDFDMVLSVQYSDGTYTYTVTADSYGMTYRQKGVTYITKWFMCDDYIGNEEFTRLSYSGGSIDLSVLEDPYYLLAFRGIIDIDDRTVNDLNNNDNANVSELNGDADAVASADDAAQAQAPAVEGEDLAADEVSNSDDLLAKADDLLQEVKDVCMWIFFLFVV